MIPLISSMRLRLWGVRHGRRMRTDDCVEREMLSRGYGGKTGFGNYVPFILNIIVYQLAMEILLPSRFKRKNKLKRLFLCIDAEM